MTSDTATMLEPAQLCRRCDPERLGFATTDALDDLDGVLGQPRAMAALAFSVGMDTGGYHVFALGPQGIGKRFAIDRFLRAQASSRPQPSDWCYVHNFEKPERPRALRLPAHTSGTFRTDMEELVEDVKTALTAAFNSEEYQTRRELIDKEASEKPQAALEQLKEHADQTGFAVLRGPVGLMFAPVRDGDVLPKEAFDELPEEQRKKVEEQSRQLEGEVKRIAESLPEWERERRKKIRELDREVTSDAVTRRVNAVRDAYAEIEPVLSYLDEVERDIIEHAREISSPEPPSPMSVLAGSASDSVTAPRELGRYQVNVLVEHDKTPVAPLATEDNPSYSNLVGRIEHGSQMGTLVTDFRLIRPGALHRANGGYLMLDARKLLSQPYSWECLKRALRSNEIRIESLGQALSLVSTISLEPEPIPLDVKVVLVGEPRVYYLLSKLDPEFGELFKVAADFATDMDRTDASELQLARLVATMSRSHSLRAFDCRAVAEIVDECARRIGDAQKLSIHAENLVDLLRESDYQARLGKADTVRAEHVHAAIEAHRFRSDRVRDRMHENIARDLTLIDTAGEQIGQINGLSVLELGTFRFGRPSRITARVRYGKGEVIDIEREVELGGPLHSKGVLILSGFLGDRYARSRPLALSASLVFEQSYFGVDGDSASAAELLALLSAIAGVPLRQELAVTGSINQRGQIQAIGGVNEKIEGFFDVCCERGLSGDQGVVIPASNVQHLMLRPNVVDAVAGGQFHIHPVTTIDDAIEILTGMTAGDPDDDGHYPEGTFNRGVDDRLSQLADRLESSSQAGKGGDG